jgi:hypothetical protein
VERGVATLSPENYCSTGCDGADLWFDSFIVDADSPVPECYHRCYVTFTTLCAVGTLSNENAARPLDSSPVLGSAPFIVGNDMCPMNLPSLWTPNYLIPQPLGPVPYPGYGFDLSSASCGTLGATPSVVCRGRGFIVPNAPNPPLCQINRCGNQIVTYFAFPADVLLGPQAGDACFYDCSTDEDTCISYTTGPGYVNSYLNAQFDNDLVACQTFACIDFPSAAYTYGGLDFAGCGV